MSKCGKGVNIVAVSAYYRAPQLQVTEAYYRTRASAAGERGGQADNPGVWVQYPPHCREGSASPQLPAVKWDADCSEMLSQNTAGQKTPAELGKDWRKGGSKEPPRCKGSGEDCLGNAAHFHLEFHPTVHSLSSRLLAPDTAGSFQTNHQPADKSVSSALSAGDESPRNL